METNPGVRRSCVDCGKVFNGTALRCTTCRRPKRKRPCINCGKTFEGRLPRCKDCRESDCVCVRCGKTFRGTGMVCGPCRSRTERTCGCGKLFKGATARCPACRRVKRTCTGCGTEFTGICLRCDRCRSTERTCRDCGTTFTGLGPKCPSCAARSWWESMPPETRRAKKASSNNARRARQAAQADVCGPVPAKVYEAIRSSGPCVYCGDAAATVDHVRPIARGGWEHESNLVPACGPCNYSKGPRLLTEWRSARRVAWGIAHSPKVAAEYDQLVAAA